MSTRKFGRVTLDGKTYVSLETLPVDLRTKYGSYGDFIIDQKQWWVAFDYLPTNRANSKFVMLTNSVIMRKATKREIQHYRSPELVRLKL